jgi:hypothetical protein
MVKALNAELIKADSARWAALIRQRKITLE